MQELSGARVEKPARAIRLMDKMCFINSLRWKFGKMQLGYLIENKALKKSGLG